MPTDDLVVVAPMPTPFRDDDRVDFDALERNTARWLTTSLSGFVLNSENGEEAFLSESEQLEIVRKVHAASQTRETALLLAGIDNPSIRESLRLAECFADAGAQLIRVRVPRLNGDVGGYFQQLVPRMPVPVVVIHQMAPGRFLNTSTIPGASAELLSDVATMDNVFAYIASDNVRFESRVAHRIGAQRRFWACNGSLLLAMAAMGAKGACMMLGNVAPQICRDILCRVHDGRLEEARILHERIVELDWQILSRGAAGLKAALTMLGYVTGAPRRPTPACDERGRGAIRVALRVAGLLAE